ncbi:MAG: hypothetical protein GF383_10155 [Candidatus Lokiarchaeota archaeon]|nr:hypothetical protein [Candidatus Lokiarchaeota archaeon]
MKNDIFDTKFYEKSLDLKNITILGTNDFASFMGYQGNKKIYYLYIKSIILARRAYYSSRNNDINDINELIRLSSEYKQKLDKIKNNYGHDAYVRKIRELGLSYLFYQPSEKTSQSGLDSYSTYFLEG